MIWRIAFTLSWTTVMAHECNDPNFFSKAMPKLMTVWHLSFFTLGKNVDNSIWEKRPTPLDQYYVCIQGLRRLSMCVHTLENSLSWHFFITYCWDMDSKFWKNLFLESDKKVRINSHWRLASNNLMK